MTELPKPERSMERWHTYTERSLRLVSSGLSRPWLCSSSCISFSFSLCGPWPLCVDMVVQVRRLETGDSCRRNVRVKSDLQPIVIFP